MNSFEVLYLCGYEHACCHAAHVPTLRQAARLLVARLLPSQLAKARSRSKSGLWPPAAAASCKATVGRYTDLNVQCTGSRALDELSCLGQSTGAVMPSVAKRVHVGMKPLPGLCQNPDHESLLILKERDSYSAIGFAAL